MNVQTKYTASTQGENPYYYGVADKRHTAMRLTENREADNELSLVGTCNYKAYGEDDEGSLGLKASNYTNSHCKMNKGRLNLWQILTF